MTISFVEVNKRFLFDETTLAFNLQKMLIGGVLCTQIVLEERISGSLGESYMSTTDVN